MPALEQTEDPYELPLSLRMALPAEQEELQLPEQEQHSLAPAKSQLE